jgi:hypothetical protein
MRDFGFSALVQRRRIAVRTTVDIRDDVFEKVKEYAAVRSISKSTAVSDVLERGFNSEVPTTWENGLLVFDPGPGAEMVTLERTLQLEDDALEDEFY